MESKLAADLFAVLMDMILNSIRKIKEMTADLFKLKKLHVGLHTL